MLHTPKIPHSRIPIANLVQEAYDKHYSCCTDKELLIAGGLDWNLVESLPALATECSKAHVIWQLCKDDVKLATVEQKKLYKQSIKTRGRLSKLIRNSDFLKKSGRKLPQYCKKRKIAECIQDLYELVYIAENIRTQEPGYISQEIVNEGKELFESLRKVSIRNVLLKDDQKKLNRKRNLAAMKLKDALGKLIRCCRDVFINDPDHAKRYSWTYYRSLNKNRPQNTVDKTS
jgi:hypothetical protein